MHTGFQILFLDIAVYIVLLNRILKARNQYNRVQNVLLLFHFFLIPSLSFHRIPILSYFR